MDLLTFGACGINQPEEKAQRIAIKCGDVFHGFIFVTRTPLGVLIEIPQDAVQNAGYYTPSLVVVRPSERGTSDLFIEITPFAHGKLDLSGNA